MNFTKKYDEGVPEGHAFAEPPGRYPKDDLLRNHGFRIHARPKGGEPVWERDGAVLPQGEALKLCRGEGKATDGS